MGHTSNKLPYHAPIPVKQSFPFFSSEKHICILTRWSVKLSVLTKLSVRPISSAEYHLYIDTLIRIISSFDCLGFAYRQPQSAGEVLNCDLTDKVITITIAMVTRRTRIMLKMTMVMVLLQDTRTLDPYSSYDFYQSQTTDLYERSGAGNDCRNQVSSFFSSLYPPSKGRPQWGPLTYQHVCFLHSVKTVFDSPVAVYRSTLQPLWFHTIM